jgi:uncharacterized membrane protein HdeD (DUF308 family)
MSTPATPHSDAPQSPLLELAQVRTQWWCFLLLGIVLTVLGALAVGCGVTAIYLSVITVALFGFLLLFGGLAQIVSAFWAGRWSGFLLHVLIGILYVVVGYLIVDAPAASAVALTLVLAAYLIVGGVFRIISALATRFHGWGWVLLNGAISVMLGIMIYKGWPSTGLWVIGLFVGIDLMFNGLSWIIFALDLRRMPATET